MKTALLALVALLCFASVTQAAGNATARLSNGTLTIVGDANANFVTVTGGGGTPVVINGLDGTTINGLVEPVSFASVRSLNINMNKGDDSLIVQVKVTGTIAVAGSAGADDFKFDGTECASIKGTVGLFPRTDTFVPSGINDTYEYVSLVNVKTVGDIVWTARGLFHLENVTSGGIVSCTNGSGYAGISSGEGSTSEATDLKCKALQLTFGRGDDTLTLTNCAISDRFQTVGNFGNDTFVRENTPAPPVEWVYEFENIVINEPAAAPEAVPAPEAVKK